MTCWSLNQSRKAISIPFEGYTDKRWISVTNQVYKCYSWTFSQAFFLWASVNLLQSPGNATIGCCSLYSQVTIIYPTQFVSALQLYNRSENWLAVFRARTLSFLKMSEDIQVGTRKWWRNLVPALAVDTTHPRSSVSSKEEHTEASCRTIQNRTQHSVFSQPAATLQMDKEIKPKIRKIKKNQCFWKLGFFNRI